MYNVIIEQCVFGARSVVDGCLLKRPAWIWCTSPEIASALRRFGAKGRCICHGPRGRCEGRAASAASSYPPRLCNAFLRGFRETVRRKDPSRLQCLCCILGADHLFAEKLDVGLDGALVVEMADGSTVEVLAGDVVHLRVD